MEQETGAFGPITTNSGGLEQQIRQYIHYIPSGDTIPEETWAGRHRRIIISIVAHIPLLLALGLYEGTESLVTGATIPSIPLWMIVGWLGAVVVVTGLASWPRLSRRTQTALASVGMMMTSTILVRFSGGYIEAHFHFFVVMAVIAVYEDWLPFAIGLGYVAGGHVIFGVIDPTTVYNHSAAISNPFAWSGIHAVFIIALCTALMSNWISIEKSREQSELRLEQVAEQKDDIQDAEEAMAEAKARREEVEALNAHLETKANEYSTTMARAADGELSVRLDTQSKSEAMTQIAGGFNEMMDEIESAMQEIQTFSREVAAATEETTTSARNAEQSSESVNESVEQISSSADEQREMLEEVSEEMSNLSATIEEVASSTQTVADTSAATADVADDGRLTAEEAMDRMGEVEDAIDSTVDNVQSLKDQMGEIGEIVDLIGDIAEQTNMLALNANIEAARAGSGSGDGTSDGFAVVADEVKTLAEETQAAAGDIEELINETQAQTDQTVDDVQDAREHIDAGATAVDEVAASLSEVADNTEEANQGIQEISKAADDQAASTEETVSMIEPVTEISRTTATKSNDVSETASEQLSTMKQVSSKAQSLSQRADKLQELLSTFDVSGSAVPDTTGSAGRPDTVAMGDGGQPE